MLPVFVSHDEEPVLEPVTVLAYPDEQVQGVGALLPPLHLYPAAHATPLDDPEPAGQ